MLALSVARPDAAPPSRDALLVPVASFHNVLLLQRLAALSPDLALNLLLALAGPGTASPSSADSRPTLEDKDVRCFALTVPVFVLVMLRPLSANVAVPARWMRNVLAVDKKQVKKIALNAIISTLGGGHFLCRHVDRAMLLARLQLRNALQAGDHELAGQCRIHMCYILVQVGKLKLARRMLVQELIFAQRIESDHLGRVALAGLVYLSKVIAHRRELAKPPSGDRLKDSFYRQRFVHIEVKV